MESYQSLIPYFPYMILGFLLLAGAFMLRILMAYSSVISNSRALKQAIAGPFSAFKGPEAAVGQEQKAPKKRGRISRAWHRFMVFLHIRKEDDEVVLNVLQAMGTLEKHLGHRDYAYKLPWFMLLGTSESGKSHLLEDLELDLPLGHAEYEHEGNRPPLKWWFFDRGIVIDVIGDLLLSKVGTDSNEKGWSNLLSLLLKYRAKRPLDGIVLTIPADELYGVHKLSHDEIVGRAKYLHTKLWSIQQTLAMRIPVYLVITKTDVIPGFKEFANELPPESLTEMMGWSSPYSIVTPFEPAWVNDAYESLRISLNQVRSEIFQEGTIQDNRDGAFIFNVELEKTREALTTYVSHVFKESSFVENLFLRGIYFTGDVGVHTAVGDHKRSERYFTPPEALGAAIEVPFEEHDKYHIAFATDLFEKKVFRESTLARPVIRILRSTSKWLNFSKLAVATVAIVWSVGLYHAYDTLTVGKDQILAFVQEVDQTMHNMRRRDFDPAKAEDAKYLTDQTIKILSRMSDINVTGSFTVFIPASWVSSYDRRLEKATATAWNEIVLQSMHAGLQERARKLFLPLVDKVEENDAVNPVKKLSFLTLNKYVHDTNEYERHVTLYNNLEATENIQDVGKIVRYLYNVDMPAAFYENSSYYQVSLGLTKIGNINLVDYASAGQKKLQLLYDRFLETIFDPTKSAVDVGLLTSAMDVLINLASDREMDQTKLYNNIDIILAVAKIITDPDLKWIEAKEFYPSERYAQLLNDIANSRILGVKIANDLSKLTQVDFGKYKAAIKELQAPLIGYVLASKEGVVLAQPSLPYQELVKNLGNLLQQTFMTKLPLIQDIVPIPPGRLLFWDESMLARASKMVDSYDKYVAEQLPLLSEDLRLVLKSIGRYKLGRHVFHFVAKAQTFRNVPQSVTGYDEQDALQLQVSNLKTSSPYFNKILGPNLTGTLSQQEARLRDVLADYVYGMLSRIDGILVREDLYGLGDDKLAWWQGVDMLGLRAFGVYDLDGMKAYLAAQKDRINLLGKDLASPILTFMNLDFLKTIVRNTALKTKWTRIVLQLDASDKQIPGNSVSVLEHFLMYDLNQVGYDSCYELIDSADPLSQTGDFFLDRRNRIRSAMVDRCKYLLQAKGVEAYNKLAQFFNMYLSGRFPFTDSQSDNSQTEAMASDVEVFLSMCDGLGEIERQTIEDYFEYTGSRQSPGQFLRQIDQIKPLLQAALDGNMNMHLPKLDVAVDFRTERNRESGGDKIIDWSVSIDGAAVDFWDQKRVGEWHTGENIAVDLQWAADGHVHPIDTGMNPNFHVSGNVASFVYQGRWSLVRLIKAHATELIKFSRETPIVLQFNVPTALRSSVVQTGQVVAVEELARVYLQLNLSIPGKPNATEEKAVKDAQAPKSTPINVPLFPASAPVITKGQIVP
jgi:type VI secretion system protein ImpL